MVVKKRKVLKRKGKKGKSLIAESFDYFKESRNYYYFVILLFVVSGLIGFFFFENFVFFDELLKEIMQQIEGMNTYELIVFIFLNNISSAFYALVFGVFFGVLPVVNALMNGTVLGYVMRNVYEVSGFSNFWRLLPHGIFELTAIFIALGLGIKLGMFIFAEDRFKELRRRFVYSAVIFVLIILPLLLLAGVIEGLLIGLTS